MTDAAHSIKSMKLYTDVERVYNELKDLGKTEQDWTEFTHRRLDTVKLR